MPRDDGVLALQRRSSRRSSRLKSEPALPAPMSEEDEPDVDDDFEEQDDNDNGEPDFS